MSDTIRILARRLLPWIITAAALYYVFGHAIDWKAIPEASEGAHLPLFIGITVFDKVVFFLVWAGLQWLVIQRFFEPVSFRRVLSIKGGSELMRSLNNSLADATFLLGVSQLVRTRLGAAVAVGVIPFAAHFSVLLVQASIALPFLPGGPMAHRGLLVALALCWLVALWLFYSWRYGRMGGMLTDAGAGGAWLQQVTPRSMLPFLGCFAGFALFDIVIQGLASRAFGVDIPWIALAARIPILYFALSIPSFGNFGTREIAWSNLFADYGSRGELVAFALWTNLIFLVMHVVIGALFFSTAFRLVRAVREARRQGTELQEVPLLHDASDA